MWGLPWGFILLLPFSWLLFRNKGRRWAKDLGLSRHALLWYIFFLLLGGFFTVSAASFYLNLGGVAALIFALRLALRLNARERLRALLAALGSGIFCFAFQTGQFWWLARVPYPTEWLLPLVAGVLAAMLAVYPAAAASGLIIGVLGGNTAALIYINSGQLAVEFGSMATINTLLLALFFCLLFTAFLRLLPLGRKTSAVKRRAIP